ncbi:MAG: hypothetical protein AVDCRST_MAG33-1337, partial [uncultured Thermomicrobiales bacterium]
LRHLRCPGWPGRGDPGCPDVRRQPERGDRLGTERHRSRRRRRDAADRRARVGRVDAGRCPAAGFHHQPARRGEPQPVLATGDPGVVSAGRRDPPGPPGRARTTPV